jgi:hypothetical protein
LAISESKTERIEEIKQRLRCSGCGAKAEATCDCGLPYVPAGVAAAKAIKANPEKSNYAIAKEIGIDEKTVRRVRGTAKAVTARRIGKDGKSYPAAKKAKAPTPTTPAVASPIDEMQPAFMQPEPTALLLSEIERLVGELAMAVEHGAHSEIFDGRVRAVTDRLLALIAHREHDHEQAST